jgi:hypothetical protein
MAFLNRLTPPEALAAEIEAEVAECQKKTSKGGAGGVIITSGPRTVITKRQTDVFLGALEAARIPLNAASYIADALILSEDFDFADEGVKEAIFYVSDESGPLTIDAVRSLRDRLSR